MEVKIDYKKLAIQAMSSYDKADEDFTKNKDKKRRSVILIGDFIGNSLLSIIDDNLNQEPQESDE